MSLVREIVLDTETTGFDPMQGDRLVEIGCVELVNHVVTGNTFHIYINPERDMPDDAFRIHGLSVEFLSQHPVFADQADAFLDFVGDAPLVIHNAKFDMGFLNAELGWLDKPTLAFSRAVDTLAIARRKYPGAPASLDALCRRFDIDNSNRTLHGALLDAELLAEVYLELIGGKQPGFALAPVGGGGGVSRTNAGANGERDASGPLAAPVGVRAPRPHAPSADEQQRHRAFVKALKDPIWQHYERAAFSD